MESIREVFLQCIDKPPKERSVEELDVVILQMQQMPAFSAFRSRHLSHFASILNLVKFEAEKPIFKEKDEGNEWYVIFEGSVEVKVGDQIVCNLGSGYGFGEVAIIEGTARTATVTTKENSILLQISGSVFKSAFKEIENEKKQEKNEVIEEEEEDEESSQQSEETSKEANPDDDLSIMESLAKSNENIRDVRLALEVKPSMRAADDILDIYEEISHIKAFSHLSSSVKRELCSCVDYQILGPGETLFKQGDVGTCWYVIYKGRVHVLVNGVTVATINEGEGFGELALITDKPRAATIVAYEDEVQLLKVEKEDYNRILKDIESNTIRLEEHGKEVLVMEKRSDPVSKSSGYAVISATVDQLVKYLEENHEADFSFLFDLFLCHRIFTKSRELMDKILTRFKEEPAGDSFEVKFNRKKKIATAIRSWIVNHPFDFESDPSLVTSTLEICDILEANDIKRERSQILNVMLSKKLDIQERKAESDTPTPIKRLASSSSEDGEVTLRKKPSVKKLIRKGFGRLSIRSGSSKDLMEEELVTSSATAVKELVKVYNSDGTYKTVEIEPTTPAKQLLAASISKFAATQGLDADTFELCEVRLDKSVRIISNDEVSLASKMSLNGRFLVRPKGTTFSLPLEMDFAVSEESTFLDLDTNELARQLTFSDHQLFCRIDPLEYVYHIFNIKGKDTSNLNIFVNRFNKINYWVVTVICSQTNLNKRVQIIKKFIKLALLLKALNNFNSLFAVLSGLSNVAVSRMSGTWRKVPSKMIEEYDNLSKLMDPSRNMKVYRSYIMNAAPPLVPFFPIIVKDLFFIHECNPTYTSSGLVNYEKFRLLSGVIRFADTFRYVQYDPNVQAIYDLRKRRSTLELMNDLHIERANLVHNIKEYINTLKVIDDIKVLSKMSRDTESPIARTKRSASLPRIIAGY